MTLSAFRDDLLQQGPLPLVFIAVIAVVVWELLKFLFSKVMPTAHEAPDTEETQAQFEDLPVPPEPHCEVAPHPPQGLHWSNPKEPFPFESETCHGTYLFFHPPTGPNTSEGPEGFDYQDYFRGKSRLWEIRLHFKFTSLPKDGEDMFFGIELEDYVPMSRPTAQAQKVVVAGIKQAIGGLYHSIGDNPANMKSGEMEHPVCVLPLWAFDQFIVTPEGEEPPSLSDPNFGSFGKKRYQRIAEYAKEIDEVKRTLSIGPTYTFAFWGNSRFLDVLNWTVIGVPLVTPIGFNKFAGRPPVHVVLYSLKENKEDPRHLRSKKTYYFRAALWSSAFRPDRRRIEALTGEADKSAEVLDDVSPSGKPKSLKRRFRGFMRRIEDCTVRTK
mmetsp:Transcript_20259/g.44237  ORF Transcript_20259/g.44237 Transcript_20259/m.44237 type:complete len:384 (-) Transcript_20259:292-1443(-)